MSHSPMRGHYELYIGWGLLEPLDHNPKGAIVMVVETLIKSHIP